MQKKKKRRRKTLVTFMVMGRFKSVGWGRELITKVKTHMLCHHCFRK
jgi:hypothetical protein